MQTLCPESGLRIAPNWPKFRKWKWRHNFPTWRQSQSFWRCFVSLVKFHVNIITSSWIMTIFFHKGMTRNPEIGNTSVWGFPNIWRLGRVMDTKFGTSVFDRILLNAAKLQGYGSYSFWVIKVKPTEGIKFPPPPPPPPNN